MTATWLPQTMGYRVDGRAVSELRQKGATEAIVSQSNAQIRVIADRLQRGEIDVSEFYAAMQRETKTLQMASAALARGGVENMRPADWNRVENVIAEQWSGGEKFAGLRAFAEDIARGRYGQNSGELSDAVLSRAGLYAQAGRATYENERVELARESGNTLARRVLGASDNCDDCVAWASDEWRPIEEVEPIASSVCGARCHCVIVTRAGDESNTAKARRNRSDESEDKPYSNKELRQFRSWGRGVPDQGPEKLVASDVLRELVSNTAPGSKERIFLIDQATGRVVDFQIGQIEEVSFSEQGYNSAERILAIHQHDNATAPSEADWFLVGARKKFTQFAVVCEDEVHLIERPFDWLPPVGTSTNLEKRFQEIYDETVEKWVVFHEGDEDLILRDTLLEVNERMSNEYGISYRRTPLDKWKQNSS